MAWREWTAAGFRKVGCKSVLVEGWVVIAVWDALDAGKLVSDLLKLLFVKVVFDDSRQDPDTSLTRLEFQRRGR